jgi:penicillin-binding protein 1A
VDRGTGKAARIGRPCAGKTGTSDGHRDVWFAGFTPELSCVVWLGYDDNSPLGGLYPATGSSHAAPLWQQFMKIVHEGLPVQKFHDKGEDRYGSRAPQQFGKRSHRPHRIGIQEMQKDYRPRDNEVPWRDVWDWERANMVWEEREKMEEWTARHSKRAEEIRTMKSLWQKMLA